MVGVCELLVVGTHTVRVDFRHGVERCRPETAEQVVGDDTADHLSANRLAALQRQFFVKYDRTAGMPTPS